MSARIREAQCDDWRGVQDVLRRGGMAQAEPSGDRWAALWRDNPLVQADPSIPIGWVLEHEGKIVGYLGNVALSYAFRGRVLRAAAARGFAVDVEHRAATLKLVAAFFSQRDVDLLLNTTANAAAAAVFQLAKAQQIPQQEYDTVLFWVTNSRAFAASALRKRGWPASAADVASWVLAPALKGHELLTRRGPRPTSTPYEVHDVIDDATGAAIDALWQRLVERQPERLLADRSATTLRWHFEPDRNRSRLPKLLLVRRGGDVVGYAATTREDATQIGLRRRRIVDLVAANDEPDVVDALLGAAIVETRRDGSHVLEVVGFPPVVRDRVRAAQAMERRYASWPYWYHARSRELQQALRDPRAWYACAFDGDASL